MNSSQKSDRRKVCVVLVDRANYGRLKPVMKAIQSHGQLKMQVIVAGTMVLERFGLAANIVERDGFEIDGRVFMELEGSTPTTMAKSVGFGIVEFSNEFLRLAPDIVLVIGDRYEALSAVVAAAYMNICIAHIQGGEVSGSIDESTRHAITKFAHFHFPSTARSAEYVINMGERRENILSVGCPCSDIAINLDRTWDAKIVNGLGSGINIDFEKTFLLVVFHPTTTEYGTERGQMLELLQAMSEFGHQTILLWPNIDAGSDHISKTIRTFRDEHRPTFLRTLTNLEPKEYLKVLSNAACAVGNSSSFVRDASFFGTPVVLVGNRQEGREKTSNVIQVQSKKEEIKNAVVSQLEHGRYEPSFLYGDGNVSERIADQLASLQIYVQKKLNYCSNEWRND